MFKNYKFQERLGNDERLENAERLIINEIEMKKIFEINEKKKVLDFLQSNQKSVYDKIIKINYFYGDGPRQIDLSKGGLFKDWDSEF